MDLEEVILSDSIRIHLCFLLMLGCRTLGLTCPPSSLFQNGLNALHLAAKEGHVDLVQELLDRGAAVDSATKVG